MTTQSLARLLVVHDVLKDEAADKIASLYATLRDLPEGIEQLTYHWPIADLTVRVTRKQAQVIAYDADEAIMEELHLSGFSFCRGERAHV